MHAVMSSLFLWRRYGFTFSVRVIDRRVCEISKIFLSGLWRWWWTFEETDPPGWRVKRTVIVVKWRVYVVEEVPD